MPLEIPEFLALAAACAPTVAPSTLLAIAKVESGLDPLAIGVNGPGALTLRARTADDAARQAGQLVAAGRSVDLGLGQINSRNLGPLGLSVADAFDPCRNLAASARVLADGYRRASPRPGGEQLALRTALSFYNTGHPERGLRNGYVARVEAVAAGRPAGRAGAVAAHPPSPAPPTWDVFGRARKAAQSHVVSTSDGVLP